MKLEITNKVLVGLNDGDSIPLERCVCGDVSEPWEFVLHTDKDDPNKCDNCGRKMWFEIEIRVFQEYEPKERPLAPYTNMSEELIGVI